MTSFVVVLSSLTSKISFFPAVAFHVCFLFFSVCTTEYTVRLNLCIEDCLNEMNSQKI